MPLLGPVEKLFGEVPAPDVAPSLIASPNSISVMGAVDGVTTIPWNAPNASSTGSKLLTAENRLAKLIVHLVATHKLCVTRSNDYARAA